MSTEEYRRQRDAAAGSSSPPGGEDLMGSARESNRGRDFFFVSTQEAALQKLRDAG